MRARTRQKEAGPTRRPPMATTGSYGINPREKRRIGERVPPQRRASVTRDVSAYTARATPLRDRRRWSACVHATDGDYKLTCIRVGRGRGSPTWDAPGRILTHGTRNETSVGNHVAMANRRCVVILWSYAAAISRRRARDAESLVERGQSRGGAVLRGKHSAAADAMLLGRIWIWSAPLSAKC